MIRSSSGGGGGGSMVVVKYSIHQAALGVLGGG